MSYCYIISQTAVRLIERRGDVIKVANPIHVEERKREIALKAASLFIKHGYIQTSMRDIARECSISVGTIYHYIHSKDDILSLFQEITSSELEKFAHERLNVLRKGRPTEAISDAIDAIISFIDSTQDMTVFWYQEARNLNPQQTEALIRREDLEVKLLKNILQWGCETGDFEINDVDLAAHNIIVLCDMWAFRRWALRKDYTLDRYKKEQTAFILSRFKPHR